MQEDEERHNDSQAGCSSMLGGFMSENTCADEKARPVKIENDSESNYSNFKAANANLFSLSASNTIINRHTTLSPKQNIKRVSDLSHSGLNIKIKEGATPAAKEGN
jgi:hypothetical protein